MNLGELKDLTLRQLGLDTDDLSENETELELYLNEGYDKLLKADKNAHVGETGYPKLDLDTDIPLIPGWSHRYLADYATWSMLRNGSAQKQSKGQAFYGSFAEAEAQITLEAKATPTKRVFTNYR